MALGHYAPALQVTTGAVEVDEMLAQERPCQFDTGQTPCRCEKDVTTLEQAASAKGWRRRVQDFAEIKCQYFSLTISTQPHVSKVLPKWCQSGTTDVSWEL